MDEIAARSLGDGDSTDPPPCATSGLTDWWTTSVCEVHVCNAPSGATARQQMTIASAACARETPMRGTLGSRIAINRPSSCDRCAIARLPPVSSPGKRSPCIARAISSS
jgi:hypothetical protein